MRTVFLEYLIFIKMSEGDDRNRKLLRSLGNPAFHMECVLSQAAFSCECAAYHLLITRNDFVMMPRL